jgi:hypothetical protein
MNYIFSTARAMGTFATCCFFLIALLLSSTGCLSPSASTGSSLGEPNYSGSIGFVAKDFMGMFGDRSKSWGVDYEMKNVALITHFPSRSEFLIYTHRLDRTVGIASTNSILEMVRFSLPVVAASTGQSYKDMIPHRIVRKNRPAETRQFDYLKMEFQAHRCISSRYTTNEMVSNILYATEFSGKSKTERRLFVTLAMIPIDSAPDTREHLLQTTDRFLRELTVYP